MGNVNSIIDKFPDFDYNSDDVKLRVTPSGFAVSELWSKFMPDPNLRFRLVGSDDDKGVVRFEEFRTFCDKVAECLRRSEMVVTQQAGKIRYLLSGLEGGSAVMELRAIPPRSRRTRDRRQEVVHFFKETVTELEVGTKVDPRLAPDDLVAFKELVTPLRRTKEIWVDNAQLTSQYVANIDKLLATPIVAEGTVTGFVEGLNVHNRNEFILYPLLRGYRIVCSFSEEIFEQVRAAIKRNVTVSGTLYYHPDRPFPDRVQVESIEIHPPDNELPRLRDLRGIFKGCTGGVSAVQFVRALRDEQSN